MIVDFKLIFSASLPQSSIFMGHFSLKAKFLFVRSTWMVWSFHFLFTLLLHTLLVAFPFDSGGSLDNYGIIPEDILGQLTVGIVKGLQYLWTLKIMHRDLKPSNILVNTQGFVKLCDFGVSVQLIDSIARTYIGTSAYMSPERLKGENYRMRAEIWSLGVLMFELVSGTFPYKSASNTTNVRKCCNPCFVFCHVYAQYENVCSFSRSS